MKETMPELDTQMGGDRQAFPETTWSLILSSVDPSSPDRAENLNRLCSRYWKPVYKFIRAAWGRSVEDAKDLTQAFFCRILEDDLVSRFQPEKGRFRSYLKGALRNFLAEAQRDGRALKRGGGREGIPIDLVEVETQSFQADLGRYSPEEHFDRQWTREVMAQAIARLREVLRAEGKEDYYRVYQSYDLTATEGERTYEEVAQELAMPVHDVKNHLTHARSRLRDLIRERVADYVASSEELRIEMNELFAG